MKNRKSLNYIVLLILAPLLILIGILGFVLPAAMSPTSGKTAYNVFHIVFGFIGLLSVFSRKENFIRGFNISFGLIDLYQAFASFAHLYPEQLFRWTRVDDYLHIIIGIGLVAVGLYGFRQAAKSN
jgi:hypothetical protein